MPDGSRGFFGFDGPAWEGDYLQTLLKSIQNSGACGKAIRGLEDMAYCENYSTHLEQFTLVALSRRKKHHNVEEIQ